MGFLFLALFGTAVLGSIAIIDDDSSEDGTSQDEDTPAPESTGEEITFDGSEVLRGTEGEDTLPAGQDTELAPDEIFLLGGDDFAIIEEQIGAGVSGGEGNDTISSTASGNVLNGDAGDDVLSSVGILNIFGGTGDDEIYADIGNQLDATTSKIESGAGNDTIVVETDVFIPDFILNDIGVASIVGGDGADELKVVYDASDNLEGIIGVDTAPESTTNFLGDLINIGDFDPSEDSLIIEVQQDPDTEDSDVTITLNQSEDNGVYTSRIVLTFAETSDTASATSVLTVTSAAPVTLEDIELVGV